ncbi:MAG: hypothetical protein LBP37_05060 [Spirochaetaceae bacterium]|jgi:hypothetical protein|nr:hypothetical protein [Spirochaetaceae bacterium]
MGSATLLDAFGAFAGLNRNIADEYSRAQKARQDIEISNQKAEYRKVQDEILINAPKYINNPGADENDENAKNSFLEYKKNKVAEWRQKAENNSKNYTSQYYTQAIKEIETNGDVALAGEWEKLKFEHDRSVLTAEFENAYNADMAAAPVLVEVTGEDGTKTLSYNTNRTNIALNYLNTAKDAGLMSVDKAAKMERGIRASEAADTLNYIAANAKTRDELNSTIENLRSTDFGDIQDWDELKKTAKEQGVKRLQNEYFQSLQQGQAEFQAAYEAGNLTQARSIADKYKTGLKLINKDTESEALSPAQELQAFSFFRIPGEKDPKDRETRLRLIEKAFGNDEALEVLVNGIYQGDPSTMGMNSHDVTETYMNVILNQAGANPEEAEYYRAEHRGGVAMKVVDYLKKRMPPALKNEFTGMESYIKSMGADIKPGSPEAAIAAGRQAAALSFLQDKITDANIGGYLQNPGKLTEELQAFINTETLAGMNHNMRNAKDRIGFDIPDNAVNAVNGTTYAMPGVKEKLLEMRNARQQLLFGSLGIGKGDEKNVEAGWEVSDDGLDVNPNTVWKVTDKGDKSGWYKIVVEGGVEKIKFSDDRGGTWKEPPAGIDDNLVKKETEEPTTTRSYAQERYGVNAPPPATYNPYQKQ